MPATLDQLILALVENQVRTKLHPAVNGFDLWGNGLGRLAQGAVEAIGVPKVSGDQVAAGALAALGFGQPRIARSRVPQKSAILPAASQNQAANAGASRDFGRGQVIDVTGGPV